MIYGTLKCIKSHFDLYIPNLGLSRCYHFIQALFGGSKQARGGAGASPICLAPVASNRWGPRVSIVIFEGTGWRLKLLSAFWMFHSSVEATSQRYLLKSYIQYLRSKYTAITHTCTYLHYLHLFAVYSAHTHMHTMANRSHHIPLFC